jgi:MFS family permease
VLHGERLVLDSREMRSAASEKIQVKSRRVGLFIAASAASIVAWSPTWLQPVMLAEFVSHGTMTHAAAGLIITFEMVSISVSAILYARIRQASVRSIGIGGLCIAAVGDSCALTAYGFGALLVTRMIAGIGEGALLMAANATLARFEQPDRAYARTYVVTNIMASVVFYVIPTMGAVFARPATFPALLSLLALTLPGVLALPRDRALAKSTRKIPALAPLRGDRRPVALIAISLFAYLLVIAAAWPTYVIIGVQTGLSAGEATHALAVAELCAFAGSLLASLVGTRFGRFLPLALGICLVESTLFTLTHTNDAWFFRLGIGAVMCGSYFVVPYFYGYAAAQDKSGRGAAVVGALAPLSFAVGPYLSGIILEHGTVGIVGWFALLAGLITVALVWKVDCGMRRLEHQPA